MGEIEMAVANHIDSLGRKRIIRRLGQSGADLLTALIFPLVLTAKRASSG